MGSSYYELGLLAAARGQREAALDLLRKAVDLDWVDMEILTDPQLEAWRGDPELEAFLAEVRAKLAEGSEE